MVKHAARFALHNLGGLSVLRKRNEKLFSVPVFHAFSESTRPNVESLCSHIAKHFRPLSLSDVVDTVKSGKSLPANAITVTIDDGYRNFLEHGHPIFRRYSIPTTLYVVSGFASSELWLWTDTIAFGLTHTSVASLRVELEDGNGLTLGCRTPAETAFSISLLAEALKKVTNSFRVDFLSRFSDLCQVKFPREPPADRLPLHWEELRALASEGVEIGCHTATHPILSRLDDEAILRQEIQGAKREIEERTGLTVRHFCYPNGKPPDIGDAAIGQVRNSGYASAVTCSWGLNSSSTDSAQIRRVPLDSTIDYWYAVELLAGLHMSD